MPASAVISLSEARACKAPLAGLQRARGIGRVVFKPAGIRTVLDRLHEDGAARIRLPRTHAAETCEAVLINTAGGLTGGDRMSWDVTAGKDCQAVITTQACEKVYRTAGGTAEVATRVEVAEGARLDWLPQETILFDGAELSRTITADLAADARLLVVEAVIFGRHAMGERVNTGVFRDCWRIHRAGKLVHAEEMRLEGAISDTLARPAVLAGHATMASVVYFGEDAEAHLERARAAIGEAGGASAFAGKLVARMTAADGMALRRALVPLIATLRGAAALPRAWMI
ncbi:MAG TPA: urease accessory protein UreD [Aestuariivirgaceae bacterium]|nr:urease accessory protein UreD [Aestuariivirgaceae bacterium]